MVWAAVGIFGLHWNELLRFPVNLETCCRWGRGGVGTGTAGRSQQSPGSRWHLTRLGVTAILPQQCLWFWTVLSSWGIFPPGNCCEGRLQGDTGARRGAARDAEGCHCALLKAALGRQVVKRKLEVNPINPASGSRPGEDSVVHSSCRSGDSSKKKTARKRRCFFWHFRDGAKETDTQRTPFSWHRLSAGVREDLSCCHNSAGSPRCFDTLREANNNNKNEEQGN